jgi:transposase
MTGLASHLSAAELESRYETAADPIAKSHFHAIWLLARDYSIDEVASILSFSTRWVRLLIKRYNEHGPDNLGDRRQGNGTAPTILTSEALSALKERLKTPPDDGGLWTGPKVARWLAGFHNFKSVYVSSAAGMRSLPSAGRSRNRGHATRKRQARQTGMPLKKVARRCR